MAVATTLINDKLRRWEAGGFEQDEGGFKPPQAYPQPAMAALSTHDLPTFAGWWRGNSARVFQYRLRDEWLFLIRHGMDYPHYTAFAGQPPMLRSVGAIVAGVSHLDPLAIMQFGLLLLIATPIARVVFSLLGFAVQRDWMYVVFTTIVLSLLLFGLFGLRFGLLHAQPRARHVIAAREADQAAHGGKIDPPTALASRRPATPNRSGPLNYSQRPVPCVKKSMR